MIREAIEKIQELSRPTIYEKDGHSFCINGDGEAEVLREPLDLVGTLKLTSLDALVKLVTTEGLKRFSTPLYITIPTHTSVNCFAQPYEAFRNVRLTYYDVNATDIPGWGDRKELPFEEAMIALRTRFQNTPDTAYALKLLSDITMGAKVTFNDNGMATTVVTKKGIDLQTNEAIRPIVTLKPYRTFQEVDQPESQFLIRINDRGISFIEADGGMWKLTARETIKAYLEKALAEAVRDGKVVIAL